MSLRYKSLLIYIAKNVTGVAFSFLLHWLVDWIDFAWCLISVVLVLSPEGNDAVPLAFTRIKANLVGAATGLILLYFEVPIPYNMGIGAVITLIACDFLKLNAGAKSTLAAMIIVLMHTEGTHVWDAALGRITAVIIGCFIGLAITWIYHSLFRINTPVWGNNVRKETEKEG